MSRVAFRSSTRSAEPVVEGSALASAALLNVEGVSRSFGSTKALTKASLELVPGSIHALAGENGSGKSTLIKILSGVVKPDEGTITWLGRPITLPRPRASQSAGIATVFQETLVVPELTIRDNIFLGTDGLVRHGRSAADEQEGAAALLPKIGLGGLDLNRPLWSLTLAQQQLVTIARALIRPWRLLVVDEGTSALDADLRDQLFDYLRASRDEGRTILFTSHRMDEIRDLADTVTVLRLGETVARLPIEQAPPETVLNLMAGPQAAEVAVGREGESSRGRRPARTETTERPLAARIENVVLRPGAAPVNLEIGRGEIFGLAGLEGQGQAELTDMLSGLRPAPSGAVKVWDSEGQERTIRTARDGRRWGIGNVPKDRKREGLFFALSTFENLTMSVVPKLNVAGFLRQGALNRTYEEYSEVVRLKGSASSGVGTLSGGNQQKVLLARVLAAGPRILVLNDSLRGVDQNTKHEVYELLRRLVSEGMCVVLLSTEILELLTLCDRIAVFHDGAVSAVVSGEEAHETDIVGAMFGHATGGQDHE